MRPTLLVTGFEPFGGDAANPSGDAARLLDGETLGGHTVRGAVLPCVFAEAPARLRSLVQAHQPAVLLCLGLAASRRGFHFERVAINLIDARIADNAGAQPVDVPVDPAGPAAAFTTLPVKAMAAALRAQGLPAEVSYTAGTYVCNQVFHAAMALPVPRAGFLHLGGDLDAAAVAAGVRVALVAALACAEDLAASAGRID
ncbi:MAG: pyroglutamyl-peptidase I [Burkholderiaceae bacterium]|nr:pyroglutamyl-peptidase I [Burkholderiaceae bacterium]